MTHQDALQIVSALHAIHEMLKGIGWVFVIFVFAFIVTR